MNRQLLHKRLSGPGLPLALALLCAPSFAQTGTLSFAGVLGNSGAVDGSLVKFAPKTALGMGVVYDKFGFLWDRGGDGLLIRYAVDGREVGQYPLPKSKGRSDQLTLVGDTIVLLVDGNLYVLPVTAASGTAPKALGIATDYISFGSKDGKIAVFGDGKFGILDIASGAVQPAGATDQRVTGIDLAPDGAILASTGNSTSRFFGGVETTDGWPKNSMTSRFQYLAPYWYGQTFHGTIRRYTADLEPAPGVVLGGGSGSFIGHLDGNHELNIGKGMADLGHGLFAISGAEGVMHLLQWNEAKTNFDIVRRLGALRSCDGMAVNPAGEVRTELGYWKWSDGPDTPVRDSSSQSLAANPTMDARGMLGIAMYGRSPRLISGSFQDPKTSQISGDTLAEKGIIGTAVIRDKGTFVLLLAANGKAQTIKQAARGSSGPAENVTITPATPVKQWSALANGPGSTMIAAGDGAVIELTPDAGGWKETRRWREWNGDQFGARISLNVDGNNLWVSDTERQRVLTFDLKTGAVLASFGTKDKAGNDEVSLNLPTTIAASGRRSAVYDSGNQRVVKLEWK